MSKEIWFNGDGDFVGASGCDSFEEMAELMIAEPDFLDYLFGYGTVSTGIPAIVKQLEFVGATVMRVPAAWMRMERWPEQPAEMSIHDRPGRGFVKVIGLAL